jgi:DNA polymerase-3 subunit epsilon
MRLALEDTTIIDPENLGDILGVYTTKGKARDFLDQIIKDFGLCPKLMGLEKGRGSCFLYQLKKCSGACAGKEPATDYNQRLLLAFEGRRLQEWPYKSPIIIEEKGQAVACSSIVVDKWCVVAKISRQPDCDPVISLHDKMFDVDAYKILRAYISSKASKLSIKPVSMEMLTNFS